MLTPQPFFPAWNYRVLQELFRLLPHSVRIDGVFNLLIFNHVATTWIFAACFYIFWSMEDPRQGWRRMRLLQAFAGFCLAVLITLVVRPWITWPPPVLDPRFRTLFPSYLWANSNLDSFPSHATLTYFVVAIGIWPIKKSLSLVLGVLVLLLISLPRVYIGGHYPIDVLASLILVMIVLPVVWRWRIPEPVTRWLVSRGRASILRELLLILWIFELGESFGSMTGMLKHFWHFG